MKLCFIDLHVVNLGTHVPGGINLAPQEYSFKPWWLYGL